MTLLLDGTTQICNTRNYSVEVVEKLRALLQTGAPADPDPHRAGFYDVHNGSRTFYIHVSPRGKVWLLASWLKPTAPPPIKQENLAAACS